MATVKGYHLEQGALVFIIENHPIDGGGEDRSRRELPEGRNALCAYTVLCALKLEVENI